MKINWDEENIDFHIFSFKYLFLSWTIQNISSSGFHIIILILKQWILLSAYLIYTYTSIPHSSPVVKYQPFTREICEIVKVSRLNAPGILPTRVRTVRQSRGYFHANADIFFFTLATWNNGDRIRSQRNCASKLSGLTRKRPAAREYKHLLKGDDEERWFLSYRGFHCNFIG